MFKSIRSRYQFLINMYVLGILALFTFVVLNIVSASYEDIGSQNQLSSTNIYSAHVTEIIKQKESLFRAEGRRIMRYPDDSQTIIEGLKVILENDDFLMNISFVKDNVVLSPNEDIAYYETSDLIAADKSINISGPYINKDDIGTIVTLSYPVMQENELLGTLIGNLDSNIFDDIFLHVKEVNHSEMWIINKNGDLISPLNKQLSDLGRINNIETLSSSDYEPLFSELSVRPEGSIFIQDSSKQTEVLCTFSTIASTPEWKLLVMSEFEESNLVAVSLIKTSISLFIILVLLSILLTKVVSNIALEPILLLIKASDNNKEVFISKSIAKRSDEVAQLFYSYNHMVHSLKEHVDNLEQHVHERTLELQQANEQLYNLATTDSLTGSMNRHQIISKIELIINNIEHLEDAKLAVLFIDLNNFKYYNDTFGHDVGDLLLIEVIKFLKQQVRESDFVGRYGGDEFIVILPSVGKDIVSRINDNILRNLEKKDYFKIELAEWLDRSIHIPDNKRLGFSIGSAVYNSSHPEDVHNLIKRADESMYIEKIKIKEIEKEN